MDEVIKDVIKSSPGLTAEKIHKIFKQKYNQSFNSSVINRGLRKMKNKGIILNKCGRWYVR